MLFVMDLSTFTVTDLKQFLRARGITTSNYSKGNLLKLARLSEEIGIETISDIDESKEERQHAQRRLTVLDNGQSACLPDVLSLKLWKDDLKSMPEISYGDIFSYLVVHGWSSDNLKRFKSSHGYLLFQSRHVSNVQLHWHKEQQSNFAYLRCQVNRETTINEVYPVWIILESDGAVIGGGCGCIGDDGACKHVVACLFSVSDWNTRHQDRNTEVGTDTLCLWDHARLKSTPLLLEEIAISHSESSTQSAAATLQNYIAKPITEVSTTGEIQNKIFSIVEGSNCQLTELFEDPTKDHPEDLKMLLTGYKKGTHGSWKRYLTQNISPSICTKVELLTRGQSENYLWYKYRIGRITSSMAYLVAHTKLTQPSKTCISQILGGSKDIWTEAMKYGRKNEPVAFQLYQNMKAPLHNNFKCRENGLIISHEYPFLAASPDGLVTCNCCPPGILEIKCTYKHRNSTLAEIAKDKTYHILLDETGNVSLKKSSKWYYQIQHQLLVCSMAWCDFILYIKGNDNSTNNICIERITPDTEIATDIIKKSELLFEKHILPNFK